MSDLTVAQFIDILAGAPSDALLPLNAEKPEFYLPSFSDASTQLVGHDSLTETSAWTAIAFPPGSCTASEILSKMTTLATNPLVVPTLALVCMLGDCKRVTIIDATSLKLKVVLSFGIAPRPLRYFSETHLNPFRRHSVDVLATALNERKCADVERAMGALADICKGFDGCKSIDMRGDSGMVYGLVLLPGGNWTTMAKLFSDNSLSLKCADSIRSALDVQVSPATGHGIWSFKEGVTMDALKMVFGEGIDPVTVLRALRSLG